MPRGRALAARIPMGIIRRHQQHPICRTARTTGTHAKAAPLDRAEATMAALIPIRKTAAWWNLTQEERRNIFETKSHHITEGVRYLPSVARQLYHSRDIG